MDDPELSELTVAQTAARLHARELSPLELTEAYLRRIERLNPEINAYITITADRATEDARRATSELQSGVDRGPLHGIPVGLKDVYATRGIRTTAGSRILATWIPEADSTIARQLRELGAVLLGKLNTHEFAFGATTNNPHYGPTRNPWNLARVPGGSSGGSAAAVAAGLALAALGTDTAGSVRIPAALCGVVGLMPTYGRLSTVGIVPVSWTYDRAGPLARTVEDAALLLQALAGYDPADAASVRIPVENFGAALVQGLDGMRIGVPRGYFYEVLDDEVRLAIEQALLVLANCGAEVLDIVVPDLEGLVAARRVVVLAETRSYHAQWLPERREELGPDLAELAEPLPSAEELVQAQQAGRSATTALRQVLEQVDVLVTPTTPITAPLIGVDAMECAGRRARTDELLIRCTAPFSQAHLPALSVPCGFTSAGLPVGLQIVGRPFDEAGVLRVGHAYEQATDWHRRRPPALGHE